jgi:tetratricopeptide (TPR) repeat protein
MLKKLTVLILFILSTIALHAQKVNPIYEKYLDFNLTRLQGDNAAALDMGVAIVDSVNDLPPKARISFYNSMGKLYENNEQSERAIPYYEKVTIAEPHYYVAHRALGYIYLTATNNLYEQLIAFKQTDPKYKRLHDEYKAMATKTIKHLEIAQACDPSDPTLAIIKMLYETIGENSALSTLDERLKIISKDCLDILSDN